MDSTSVGFGTPFDAQIDFFRAKLNLPSAAWDDIRQAAHDRAFIVAGAMKADLLNDLHGAVGAALAGQLTYDEFHQEFLGAAQKHGWTGWTGSETERGQAWRTLTVYRTNMLTSYAAGRYQQLTTPAFLERYPYWVYHHLDGQEHPRPLHASWDGLTLPWDHPFWATHFPPNGWGCHCWVTATDEAGYQKALAAGKGEPPAGWDKINPKTGVQVGIDRGWAYAPGANTDTSLADFIAKKLINLDSPVGAAMWQQLAPAIHAERVAAWNAWLDAILADPVKRRRWAVAGAMDSDTLAWLSGKELHPAGAEITVEDTVVVGAKAERHQRQGNALTVEEWRSLPMLLRQPEQILFDTRSGHLLYVFPSADGRSQKITVELNFLLSRGKGETNAIVSAFKTPQLSIDGEISGGFFEVVK
jgi:hypothetical protein